MKKIFTVLACAVVLLTGCDSIPENENNTLIEERGIINDKVRIDGYSLDRLGYAFNEELSDLSMRYLIYHSDTDDTIYDLGINYTYTLRGGLTFAVTYLPWNDDGKSSPVIVSVLQGFKKSDLTDNALIQINTHLLSTEEIEQYIIFSDDDTVICDFTLALFDAETIEDYLENYRYDYAVSDYSTASEVYYHIHDGFQKLVAAPR